MGLLKKLTELTNSNHKSNGSGILESQEKEKITFHEDGYNKAEICQGNAHNLHASLEAIYQKFEKECKVNMNDQEKLKQPYLTEQKGKMTALVTKGEELKKLDRQITNEEEDIEKMEEACIGVKSNPEKYISGVDHKATAKFWIGMAFLIPLAIYIFIFYISTSFSAFFREFSLGSGFVEGMFYPQALSKAYEEGLLELGFIIFIPFVFFALGYLIHMFQHQKGLGNYLKVAGLFIVTFMFDALLAYLIDEKLYNLNKTFDSPEFNLSLAFQSVSFWVIIFAGFVSYMVWGLVFDFVMKEHAEKDKIKAFILGKQQEIRQREKKIEKIKGKKEKVEEEVSNLKIRIAELQNIIDGFILPVMNYKALSTEFIQGWLQCVSEKRFSLLDNELDKLLLDCKSVYEKHIRELEINTDDYQNKVYTQKL